MRFLTISLGYHPDVPGGAWRVAAAQAAGLARRGHTVEVVTSHPGGAHLPMSEERGGVRIFRYPQRHEQFFTNWRSENRAAAVLIRERLAASNEPVLLIQHHAYLEPAVACTSAKVLHTYHGPWAEEYRYAAAARPRGSLHRTLDAGMIVVMHRVERRALRRAAAVLVLSRHMAGQITRWHGRRMAPIEIAPGGVDFEVFHPRPDREEVRKAWQLAPDELLLVALRRLDPRMGLDVLIHAFAGVVPQFPRARLWLTGRGPAEAGLRRLIAERNLGHCVKLLGVIDEEAVPRLLNAADAALMPSIDLEGFGLATAEALACGAPVLGSRCGATPELLEDLSPALLFAPNSVHALEVILRETLSGPGRLPSRSACAAYARQRFSWDHQTAACERIAHELLGTSAAR
jgi:glycosyltransferase involved in cell wall biosynthesis